MVKTASLGIRVQPELKAALETLAKEDGRSMANYIERVLTKHVEASKKPKKRGKS